MIIEIFAGIVIITSLLILYSKNARPKGFPPGPFILPIVGNLFQLGKKPFESIKKWREKYGNIVGVKFGDYNIVIIHDYKLIKEAWNESAFSGRPLLKPFELIAGAEKRGILVAEGHSWTEQRRFCLKNLKDFGFGKRSMESMVQDDILELINTFKNECGHPISTERSFSLAVLNSLWHILTGEGFKHDDPKFLAITAALNAAISTASITVLFMPLVTSIAPELSGWTKFTKAIPRAKSLIQTYIDEHKETFQDNSIMRDFMDVYLQEIYRTTDPESSFYKTIGDENMLVSILNLFGAGAETTSGTLNWSLLFLSRYPEVQQKLRIEIDEVIGNSRLSSLDDKDNMPYTEAVMHEVLRRSSLVPIGIAHNTMEDVEFHGFHIPKNTVVLAHLHEVNHDVEAWQDPLNFRPERFLTEDGKQFDKSHPPLVPFSVGKRVCLGETLARNNFFLFLTSLFQRFEVFADPDDLNHSVEPVELTLLRFPPKFKVIFKDRQEQ